MAGGIFVDHPNPKCLLFSAIIMAGVYHGFRIFKPIQTANTQCQDS